ncbi:MAG TPA: tetratricopeptide repeat protein [Thermoanaerobaculia bacterium]
MRKTTHRKAGLVLCAAAIVWIAQAAEGQSLDSDHEGVVVETVAAGFAGATAGLQPGDEILSWSSEDDRGPTGGWIRFPFELSGVEWTYTSRADVILSGQHGSRPTSWLMPRALWWRITVRPGLPSQAAELYQEGKEKIATGDVTDGEILWRSVADGLTAQGDSVRALWLLQRMAEELSKAKQWSDADAVYDRALQILQGKPDVSGEVRILRAWGGSFLQRSAWDQAMDRFGRALDLQRQVVPRTSREADILVALGNSAWYKGDLAKAEGFHRQALKAFEELAPESLDLASALNNWANVATDQGDLDSAEESLRHAGEILLKIDPGSLLHGIILSGLGSVMFYRADLSGAEDLFRQALAIFEQQNPDGDETLRVLSNLAEVTEARGDLATSEDLLLRSLHLVEKRGEDSMAFAEVLENLAHVARDRGDLDTAERRLRRSLQIAEARVPGSPKLAEMLASSADLARRQGNLSAARNALHRALKIQKQQAPGSFHVAEALLQLANVELASGDAPAAERDFQGARSLLEGQIPGSPALAEALRGLGDVAARRREWQPALDLYRQAQKQQEKTGIGTAAAAQILHALGRAEHSAGLMDESRRHLCEALDVLDRQRRKLGGTEEARTAFEASLRDLYSGCLEALLAQGRPAEAFATLERGRARAFLDLLAERDLEISGLSPDMAAERRQIDAEYDRLQAEILAPAPNTTAGALEELQGKLRDLNARQEELTARIRQDSPRFASLRYPEPLSLAGARAMLDPGTVLLEYVVEPERSWIFAVQSSDVSGPGL